MLGWWNGIHDRLKICWPIGRAGSSPAPSTGGSSTEEIIGRLVRSVMRHGAESFMVSHCGFESHPDYLESCTKSGGEYRFVEHISL